MEATVTWPAGVYLETSILRKLPLDVATAELVRLIEICKALEIPIAVPMVALDEWVASRKLDFVEKAGSYESATEKLTTLKEKYLIYIDLPSFDSLILPKDKKSISDEIETMLKSRLRDIGIIAAETPNIKLELLLKMSIDKVRPFEEKGEKGFRDSVILFTILEYAKKLPVGFHLLVTEDQVFNHPDVNQTASDHNVKLVVVRSIQEAIDKLNNFIGEVLRQHDAKRKIILKHFLDSHREEISEFISEQRSFTGLFGFGNKTKEGFSPQDIKAITSVELLEIHNPTPGTLPNGAKKDRAKISFSAKVKFSLIITQHYFGYLDPGIFGPPV